MDKLQPKNSQIIIVQDFEKLMNTSFNGVQNAICWQRTLEGDFEEIVKTLTSKANITEVSAEDLCNLQLSVKGAVARAFILADLKLLTEAGASPSLNLIKNYDRDNEFDFISTDVYSFHVDHSPVETSTFLCTYYGADSEILPNDQAVQKIMIPEVRESLRKLHAGSDQDFDYFLKENYFDLHYDPNKNAQPIGLGKGNLWRLSVDHPEQKVPPCIHRAPKENDGEYRLLLIC